MRREKRKKKQDTKEEKKKKGKREDSLGGALDGVLEVCTNPISLVGRYAKNR